MNMVTEILFQNFQNFHNIFLNFANFQDGPLTKSMPMPKKRIENFGNHMRQSERARTISKIEKRKEFVPGLCIEQSPKKSFKGSSL